MKDHIFCFTFPYAFVGVVKLTENATLIRVEGWRPNAVYAILRAFKNILGQPDNTCNDERRLTHCLRLSLAPAWVCTFVSGVLITETTLMLQGFEAIGLNVLPFANYILFGAAIIMAMSLLLFITNNKKLSNGMDIETHLMMNQ